MNLFGSIVALSFKEEGAAVGFGGEGGEVGTGFAHTQQSSQRDVFASPLVYFFVSFCSYLNGS